MQTYKPSLTTLTNHSHKKPPQQCTHIFYSAITTHLWPIKYVLIVAIKNKYIYINEYVHMFILKI